MPMVNFVIKAIVIRLLHFILLLDKEKNLIKNSIIVLEKRFNKKIVTYVKKFDEIFIKQKNLPSRLLC